MLKNFKEKYNSNPKFKQKAQRAIIFFGLFVVCVSIFYATNTDTSDDANNDKVSVSDSIAAIKVNDNYIPADTTLFVSDKTYFYSEEEKKNRRSEEEVSVASAIDNTYNENKSVSETDAALKEYLNRRKESIRQMRHSSSSSTSYGGRRSYNYQGNSEDYITTSTAPELNYSSRSSELRQNFDRNQNNNSQQSNYSSQQAPGVEVPVRLLSQKDYVVSGERLTFALLVPCKISGVDAPKGQTITGTVRENGDRMTIQFQTVKIKNQVVRANITLYGNDGMEGIAISGEDDANENFAQKEGTNLLKAAASSIPVVGATVGKTISHGSETITKNSRKIKLIRNFTCFVVIK